jgi:hypothetical protein
VNPARKNNGQIKITAEEKKAGGETAYINLKGEITNSGPLFFIIWKNLSPGQFKPVYKSEIQHPTKGCQVWSPVKLDT